MDSQFSDIRKEYKKGKLTRNTISENPFEQFARWLNDALHCGENEPTAMIVATVSPDGRPSTRTVLLKGVENGKLIFFTNYESRKGRQLTANPCLSAIKGVNQAFARFTPNFTPKNVKLGVFVFFKILQKNVNYKAIGISMDWQNEPL